MAVDNISVTPGTGVVVAADDVGGVLYQRVKVGIGADGAAADLAFGSSAAATSLPVAQSTEDIARMGIITETAPASDTASSGLNGRMQRVAQNLSTISAVLPTSRGSRADAASLGVTLATEDKSLVGALVETAPVSDTASSGLNGRLQRIAQNISAMSAKLPSSLGIKVASGSLSVTMASDDAMLAAITAIQTGTATVNVADDSSILKLGNTSVTPKFAKIAASSSGVNIVVAAVATKKIRVLSYVLNANGTVNAKWQSHTTPTDLTGLDYLIANTGVSSGYSPVGHFETVAGESLDLNLSAAIAVGGHITYIEV